MKTIPNTPEIQGLFDNRLFWIELQKFAPLSWTENRPLKLVNFTPAEGLGADRRNTGPFDARWENCEEYSWWSGSGVGMYDRQDIRAVTPDQVRAAAANLFMLSAELAFEIESWEMFLVAEKVKIEAEQRAAHVRSLNLGRRAQWEATIKDQAARLANAAFPGRENKKWRNQLRAEIEAKLFAVNKPPAELTVETVGGVS